MLKLYGIFVCICIGTLFICNGEAAEFKNCGEGSEIGEFTKVSVSKCKASAKTCTLKRGTNATIEIDFRLKSVDSVENITTVVHGIVAGIAVPFPLDNPDPCSTGQLTCPLSKDESYKYVQTLPIRMYYPPTSVTVKWELKDADSDKSIFCVVIPAKIPLL